MRAGVLLIIDMVKIRAVIGFSCILHHVAVCVFLHDALSLEGRSFRDQIGL